MAEGPRATASDQARSAPAGTPPENVQGPRSCPAGLHPMEPDTRIQQSNRPPSTAHAETLQQHSCSRHHWMTRVPAPPLSLPALALPVQQDQTHRGLQQLGPQQQLQAQSRLGHGAAAVAGQCCSQSCPPAVQEADKPLPSARLQESLRSKLEGARSTSRCEQP